MPTSSDTDENEPRYWPDGSAITPWADPWHDIRRDIKQVIALIEMESEFLYGG